MKTLGSGDLRVLVGLLQSLYRLSDLDDFVASILEHLPKVVDCECIAYNEYDPGNHQVRYVVEPQPSEPPGGHAILQRYMHQHPVARYYGQTGDGQALKISDFLTLQEFHRLELYNEFYRLASPRVEDILCIMFPAIPPLAIAVTFCRDSRSFTERDRTVSNLLRPHLMQAYRNAQAFGSLQHNRNLGTVSLDGNNRVRWLSPKARVWIEEYFGKLRNSGSRLPEELEGWVKLERGLRPDEPRFTPFRPMVMEREGKRLNARISWDVDQSVIILEEERTLNSTCLRALGLTPRQAEVLGWVAQGKSNPTIGVILGTSPRTVEKHLERILRKLGVETRTAAALLYFKAQQRRLSE